MSLKDTKICLISWKLCFWKLHLKSNVKTRVVVWRRKLLFFSLIRKIFLARYSLFNIALINYACDWRQRNLKLHYHPTRGKSKCTYDFFARVFSHLARVVCLLSALSLVHLSVCHVVVIDRSNFFDPVFAMQRLSWKRVESQQDLQFIQNRGNELPWTSLRIMGNASIFIVCGTWVF